MFKGINCIAALAQIMHQLAFKNDVDGLYELEDLTNLFLCNEIICNDTDFIIFGEAIDNIVEEMKTGKPDF